MLGWPFRIIFSHSLRHSLVKERVLFPSDKQFRFWRKEESREKFFHFLYILHIWEWKSSKNSLESWVYFEVNDDPGSMNLLFDDVKLKKCYIFHCMRSSLLLVISALLARKCTRVVLTDLDLQHKKSKSSLSCQSRSLRPSIILVYLRDMPLLWCFLLSKTQD